MTTPAQPSPLSSRMRRMLGRRIVVGAASAATAVVVAGTGLAQAAPVVSSTQTAPAPSSSSLQWGPCPDAPEDAHAECTTVTVPKDYSNPSAGTIELTVSRIAATGTSESPIFTNPGGPGGGALDMWESLVADKGVAPLRENHDLIAVQPRGLPNGHALECDGELKSSCLSHDPVFPNTVTTESTARDMEEVRKALGVDTIDYYGVSYGTYLGAVYATLFPQNTGKFVLDSAVNPDVWMDNFVTQGEAQQKRFESMLAWIAEHDAEYHLGDTPLKVYQRWSAQVDMEATGSARLSMTEPPAKIGDVPPGLEAVAQAYLQGQNIARPVKTRFEGFLRTLQADPSKPNATAGIVSLTSTSFFSSAAWPYVADYLNNPTPNYAKPSAKSAETSAAEGRVFTAVVCNENAVAPRYELTPLALFESATGAQMPAAKSLLAKSGLMCQDWLQVTKPVSVDGSKLATKPLVLQSLGDSQTPYAGGVELARRIQAHLITVDGGDHGTFYRRPENDPLQAAVFEYFETGSTSLEKADARPISTTIDPERKKSLLEVSGLSAQQTWR